jgi:hypothetical protein
MEKTPAYFEICPFSVNYKSLMFYSTGHWHIPSSSFDRSIGDKDKKFHNIDTRPTPAPPTPAMLELSVTPA